MAQRAPAGVPYDLHQGLARTDETGITFCIDQRDIEWPLHQEVGTALAEALLLEARFFMFGPKLSARVTEVQGLPDDLLFVLLDDYCDAFLGIRIQERVKYPEFFMITQAYMQTGLILASLDRGFSRLDHILALAPSDITVGVSGDSPANVSLALFMPEIKRRVYKGELAVFQALLIGEIEAGILWEPTLYGLLDDSASAAKVYASIANPLPASDWEIGLGVMSNQTYLRELLDEAVSTITSDGTIDKILARHKFRTIVTFEGP